MSWCLPRFELKKSLAKAMTGVPLGRTDRGLSRKDEPATLATKLEPAAPLRRCVGTIRGRSEPTENYHRVCRNKENSWFRFFEHTIRYNGKMGKKLYREKNREHVHMIRT